MTYDLLGFFSSLIVLFTVYCHFVCTYFPVNFNVICLYSILLSFLLCFIILYCCIAMRNKVYITLQTTFRSQWNFAHVFLGERYYVTFVLWYEPSVCRPSSVTLVHAIPRALNFSSMFLHLRDGEILGQIRRGSTVYIGSPKKYTPWCLIITLGNVDRFSKFFHQLIGRKILYVPVTRFPPHMQYVATLPCEIGKSKNVTEFSLWT